MNVGPAQPLPDSDQDRELRELLEAGGLKPIDINVLPTRCEPIRLEITPPNSQYFFIHAISSRCMESCFHVEQIEIGDRVVLRDFDPAIYNLRHLVPYELGVISTHMKLWIQFDVSDTLAIIPPFMMTLWGRERNSELAGDAPRGKWTAGTWTIDQINEKMSRPLYQALRLLKQHEIPIEDDELRSLMDKAAFLLQPELRPLGKR